MRVFRLCRVAYKDLDGEGARLYGGRWNSPGRPVVYMSSTLALAALEYLVHVDPSDVPADLIALAISIPDDVVIQTVDATALPSGWAHRAGGPQCQEIGDRWLAAGSAAVLRVPAAPIPEESNLLLNPPHPDATRFEIVAERPFVYDPRLTD
ncbi:MAG: RES family NAD+ phosphorylase [Gemmatimonadaceae bacterium]